MVLEFVFNSIVLSKKVCVMTIRRKSERWNVLLIVSLLALVVMACGKEDAVNDLPPVQDTQGDKAIDWSKRVNGSVYTAVQAAEDFGGATGWVDGRAHIVDGLCRVTLLKNALVAEGGLVSRTVVPSGSEYELSFDIKFDADFDWSRGGKSGLGFKIGQGYNGCRPAWNGDGGSLRIMWYQNDQNRVYFIPYVYFVDMPSTCGHNFGKTYPATGSLSLDTWYKVSMYFKRNTGANADGHVTIKIDDNVLLDQSIRWTTDELNSKVNGIYFHTFRGGSESHWESDADGFVYYRNLRWKRLAN